MRPDKLLPLLLLCVLPAATAFAESSNLSLRHNPFARPAVLEEKPHTPAPQVATVIQSVELELSATMVSANAPMVIVEGELLGIGDSIRGLKLVRVMEGKAMFDHAGKILTFSVEGDDE